MLDVIVDLDVTGLRTAIEHAYPNQQVQVQADGGRLVLTGSVPDTKAAEDLNKMATVYSHAGRQLTTGGAIARAPNLAGS